MTIDEDELKFRRHIYTLLAQIINGQSTLLLACATMIENDEVRRFVMGQAQALQVQSKQLCEGLEQNLGQPLQ